MKNLMKRNVEKEFLNFIIYFLFLFFLISIWTHYKDPEGFSLLGKFVNLIISILR